MRVLTAEKPRLVFKLKLCPPMALELLSGVSGDFGTSPFFEQLLGKQVTAHRINERGVPGSKHNGLSRN
jgi:hypothetical protein